MALYGGAAAVNIDVLEKKYTYFIANQLGGPYDWLGGSLQETL